MFHNNSKHEEKTIHKRYGLGRLSFPEISSRSKDNSPRTQSKISLPKINYEHPKRNIETKKKTENSIANQPNKDLKQKLKLMLGSLHNEDQIDECDSIELKQNQSKTIDKQVKDKKVKKNSKSREKIYEDIKKLQSQRKKYSKHQKKTQYQQKSSRSLKNNLNKQKKQKIISSAENLILKSLKRIKKKIQTQTSAKVLKKKSNLQRNSLIHNEIKVKDDKQADKNVYLFDLIQNRLEISKEINDDKENKLNEGIKKIRAVTGKVQKVTSSHHPSIRLTQCSEEISKKIPHYSNWKRIKLQKNGGIKFYESSFDEQIQKIQCLQGRNEKSLKKYLEHQKIIVQLEFQKKKKIKIS